MSPYESCAAISAVVSPPLSAFFTNPNSVGPDTASMAASPSVIISPATVEAPESESTPSGVTKEVIWTGKEISRNTRPTKAGLNGLHPNPPKVIFPTPIATNAPTAIIQIGNVVGRLNPSSTPVTMAEQSPIVGFPFNKKRWIKYSKSTQHATETAVTISAGIP